MSETTNKERDLITLPTDEECWTAYERAQGFVFNRFPDDRYTLRDLGAIFFLSQKAVLHTIESGQLPASSRVPHEEKGEENFVVDSRAILEFRRGLEYQLGKRFLIWECQGKGVEIPSLPEQVLARIKQEYRQNNYHAVELSVPLTRNEISELTRQGFRLLSEDAFEEYEAHKLTP